jgi:hypothetical protein
MTLGQLTEGVHDISSDLYHSDPCPEPSLSSSITKILLEQTPVHAKTAHPRLTDYPDLDMYGGTKAQDMGTLVHKLILGAGQEFVVVNHTDWRTNAAKELRDQALSRGLLPVLKHTLEEAHDIAASCTVGLVKEFGQWPLGISEQTMIWKRKTLDGGFVWCRALVDHLVEKHNMLIDLKTTGKSIGDTELAKKFAGDGADYQAAHYLDGFETLFPLARGRSQFLFVVVETDPPYQVRVADLREGWRTLAAQMLDIATEKFAHGLKTGEWPGWDSRTSLAAPGWRESQFTNRLLMEEA